MDDTMQQLMYDRLGQVMDRYHEALERACEQALQGGVCGVLVVHHGAGEWTIGPHVSVPYGTIHEFPQGMLPSVARSFGIPDHWAAFRG